MILNPFGEVYPKSSADIKPVYNIIRDYLRNGGIFVNTAELSSDIERYRLIDGQQRLLSLVEVRRGLVTLKKW